MWRTLGCSMFAKIILVAMDNDEVDDNDNADDGEYLSTINGRHVYVKFHSVYVLRREDPKGQ